MHQHQSIEFEKEPDRAAWLGAKSMLRSQPMLAIQQFRALAERGSLLSMLELGRAYASGIGTPIDVSQAEMWFGKVAQLGSIRAHWYLGRLLMRQRKYQEAKDALSFSAARGYAPALFDIGRLYLHGWGVERDRLKAQNYFERSADAGNVFAKTRLAGLLLRSGKGFSAKLKGVALVFSAYRDLLVAMFSGKLESERFFH
jgi:TPR repeat protein